MTVLYSAGGFNFAPLLKGSILDGDVIAGNPLFSSDLEPTAYPTTFRIYAAFTLAGVLTVRRTSGGTVVAEDLNGGGALAVNAAYLFDIIVEYDESINISYSVGGANVCLSLKVLEVAGAVS